MKEIETKFGSLYYEETPADGYALLSSDEKVIAYFGHNPKGVEHEFKSCKTWNEFVELLQSYAEPFMWALSLKDLKDNFHDYQVETYGKTALTKSKCNKIVNEDYVIIGKHYMLFDFIEY